MSHMVQLLYVVTVKGAQSSHEIFSKSNGSDFPVLQWLRPHLPRQRVQVQSLVKELRLHMPVAKKQKTIKQKQYCNKFYKDFKNGPYQKKNLKKKAVTKFSYFF